MGEIAAYRLITGKIFKSHTAYPAALFWGLVGSFLFFFIQASLWSTLLGEGSMDGIGFDAMITYLVLNTCVEPFTGPRLGYYITRPFKSGDIAVTFSRPLSFKGQILSESMGAGLFRFFISAVPLSLLVLLVYGLIPPVSFAMGAAFLLTALLGIVIGNQLNYLIGLFVFWFKSDYYTKFLSRALVMIFGGTMVPLWFYPDALARFCSFLPYQLILFKPMEIYLGREDQIMKVLALDFIWIGILLILEWILWKQAKKVVTIQGG